MERTQKSGKSAPPDSPFCALIDGNVSRSPYHAPNPPSSPLVFPSHPAMDIDTPLPPADHSLTTLDRISSLELALCSNFTCCSIQLPDLHALVEHFEEKHVVALTIDGKRIYPENTSGKRLAVFPPLPPSLSNSPSSSRSSSPPTPTIPLATASFLTSSPTTQMSESGGVYTPFGGMMMIPPPDEDPYGFFDSFDTYPIMSTSPPSYNSDFHSHASCSSSSSTTYSPTRSHDPMILNPDCHSDVIITVHDLDYTFDGEEGGKKQKKSPSSPPSVRKKECITDREGKKARAKVDSNNNAVLNVTAVSAKNAAKTKMRLLGGNNVKRREKAYRCPKAGCTKSYLNPNGLKYHLEKGTCQIGIDSPLESCPPTTNPPHTQTPNDFPTPRPTTTTTSPPHPLPFLKIENYLTALQRTPSSMTMTTMMMPTPPATPGSESPNCETNLPLPSGPVYRVSSPIPVALTPVTPTAKAMVLPLEMRFGGPMSPS